MKRTLSPRPFVTAALLAVASTASAQVAAPTASRTPSVAGATGTSKPETKFNNPLVLNRADSQVYQHTDGYLYFMGTVPEYDRLELRRAKTLNELTDTPEVKTIWKKRDRGIMGAHIWAPEIHFIDGKWYCYFAAGGAERIWEIRTYVLENSSPNPLEGEWVEKGRLLTGWDSFTLDASTFEHKGTRYLIWAQKTQGSAANSDIYIAKMDTPLSITGKAVCLVKPELPWEKRGRLAVAEGPIVLKRNGRIFLTYSAAATDATYCLGMLTADENADLLDPASWKKSPEPVLKTHEENKVFGPGHNSFITTPEGEDVIIYHARNYKEIMGGDALRDPNRHTRAQVIKWNPDGTPNFMPPVPDSRPVVNRILGGRGNPNP